MYKIFFKDRAIILTDHIDADLGPDFGAIHKLGSEGELKNFLSNFEANENLNEAVIYHHNKHELFRRFRGYFKNLQAAGGVVLNLNKDSFLTIIRRNRPDLPKGKVELNETFEEAAVREVSEECGINPTEILAPLGNTFHTYYIGNQHILKETRWFEMIYRGDKEPTPQKEEDITQVKWLPISEAKQFAQKTYPSIKEIINTSLSI